MDIIITAMLFNADIIILALIMTGFIAVIAYSAIKDSHRKRLKEEPKELQPQYAHPPMDLRLRKEEEE